MTMLESSKPKKQRLFFHTKALHRKQKGLSAHLNKKMKEQLGKRSMPLRKGDTVKVMRGSNKGKQGKVSGVDYRKGTVNIEKVTRKKADGTEAPLPVKASNLLAVDLDKSDSRRIKVKKEKKKEKQGD